MDIAIFNIESFSPTLAAVSLCVYRSDLRSLVIGDYQRPKANSADPHRTILRLILTGEPDEFDAHLAPIHDLPPAADLLVD